MVARLKPVWVAASGPLLSSSRPKHLFQSLASRSVQLVARSMAPRRLARRLFWLAKSTPPKTTTGGRSPHSCMFSNALASCEGAVRIVAKVGYHKNCVLMACLVQLVRMVQFLRRLRQRGFAKRSGHVDCCRCAAGQSKLSALVPLAEPVIEPLHRFLFQLPRANL